MRCLPSHYGLFLSRAISQNSFFLKLLLVMLLYHGNKEVTEADTQQGIRKSQMSYSRKRGAALGWGVLAGLPSSNGLFTETKRKFLKMASAVQALPCQRHHLSQDHVNVTIEEIRLGVNSSYQPRKLGWLKLSNVSSKTGNKQHRAHGLLSKRVYCRNLVQGLTHNWITNPATQLGHRWVQRQLCCARVEMEVW